MPSVTSLMARRTILDVRNVKASYGPFRALFGVSFSVPAGSTVALLGPNGAGKSTVARVVSGLVRAISGSVTFDGVETTHLPAWKIARMGMAHAPEGRAVFGSLTVAENLELAFRRSGASEPYRTLMSRAYSAFPRLGERTGQLAETLSGGEQRMLALARVLAVPPKLLVVDEISLGLAPVIIDEVFDALRTIREAGTTLLLVEQQVSRAIEVADRAILLSKGEVVIDGPVSELGDAAGSLLPELPGG